MVTLSVASSLGAAGPTLQANNWTLIFLTAAAVDGTATASPPKVAP